jgi:RimJ/RimL family protein N-acetyltransferase
MDQSRAKFPSQFESKRLRLRSYHAGDGSWYYAMSLRNRAHLQRYEADNAAMQVSDEQSAEALVRGLAEAWEKGSCFFIGAFDKRTHEFTAQIYVGPVDRQLPEFEIGYFADVNHEGKGYVSEAVWATLEILFEQLGAHRVSLKCDETNRRSIHVAERCHMTREGILRENRRNLDGSYGSAAIYGLLKHEYELWREKPAGS